MRQPSVPKGTGRVLDAYRQTLAEVRGTLSHDDGQWLRVGVLLENSALLPAEDRGTHLALVAEAVREALGPVLWAVGHRMDPVRAESDAVLDGRFRTFCEIVEDAGALVLADAMLDAYLRADPAVESLERARVEAVRARLAWKSGDLEMATERYRRVAVIARREKSDELRVRAWIGYAIVARLRGNYPRSREFAQRAVSLAERRGMERLTALAYHTLTVGGAVARDFGTALAHGWRAYLHSVGDPTMESESLANLGQLFLDAGHPEPATAAFLAVIGRAPAARILVPALGGLAVAASRTGDRQAVERAQREIEASAAAGATPYDVAGACLDLARAWDASQEPVRASAARRRALEIAREFRFHEIEHHAQERVAVPAPVPQPLPAKAEEVADAVLQLVGV